MKTQYKHISFERAGNGKWTCFNRGSDDDLGAVEYYKPWSQYIFEPCIFKQLVFSAGCLRNIAHFLGQLNKPGPKPK